MNKIIIIAVIVIALVAIYWLLGNSGMVTMPSGEKVSEKAVVSEPSSGMGGQLFDQIQQNPGEKLPDTNPFNKDLNPYSGGYVNPFQ